MWLGMLSLYNTEQCVILLKGVKIKRMCVLSSTVGLCFVIFGILCLLAPFFLDYEDYSHDSELLLLDEIGVFAAITGAVLYGTSMIALAIASQKGKPD
jgi:hypothetical protein